jgi:cytochrome c553
MSKTIGWLTIVLALGYSQLTLAGDAAAGQARAALCAACHGATGTSPNELWPNLAGQKEGYLIKQMKAFRDGERNDPMMSPMAKPLSDADIENLAAFFASQSSE